MFRPFAQVERGYHQTEGTGLGLVICRSLCEMMGGRLSLSSVPDRGTRVEVELRLHRLEALILPDNEPSRRLVARVGFRFEGVSRRLIRLHGRWRDHERWAITREDAR